MSEKTRAKEWRESLSWRRALFFHLPFLALGIPESAVCRSDFDANHISATSSASSVEEWRKTRSTSRNSNGLDISKSAPNFSTLNRTIDCASFPGQKKENSYSFRGRLSLLEPIAVAARHVDTQATHLSRKKQSLRRSIGLKVLPKKRRAFFFFFALFFLVASRLVPHFFPSLSRKRATPFDLRGGGSRETEITRLSLSLSSEAPPPPRTPPSPASRRAVCDRREG